MKENPAIGGGDVDGRRPSFPPGAQNAFWFAAFNALSFQIVLSNPMILYAKGLGASATVLGIIAGMTSLLVIFQIPGAHYIHRIGYRRFVLSGWGIRVLFIFCMAAVPLLGFLPPETRLSLILLFLFGFNLSRGISSCAWLPWITALIPERIRGRYLMMDAVCINCASFLTMLLAASVLGGQPSPWQFSFLFAFSGAMGAMSLVYLNRIPDVPVHEEVRTSRTPVPWKEIIAYAPFQKLMQMAVIWAVASGGLGAFTVAFLKVEVGMPEGKILFITSASFIGGLSSFWFLGPRLDRAGSRPVLTLTLALYIVILAGWFGMAGKILGTGLWLIIALQFLMGLAAAVVSMATTRLAMGIIPQMGRNHFFALYSVVGSLTMGVSPIAWGLMIDSLRPLETVWLGVVWTRYTVFFLAAAAAFFVAILFAARLDEPEAGSLEALLRDLLIQSPQRMWLRLWPRN